MSRAAGIFPGRKSGRQRLSASRDWNPLRDAVDRLRQLRAGTGLERKDINGVPTLGLAPGNPVEYPALPCKVQPAKAVFWERDFIRDGTTVHSWSGSTTMMSAGRSGPSRPQSIPRILAGPQLNMPTARSREMTPSRARRRTSGSMVSSPVTPKGALTKPRALASRVWGA